MATKTESVKMKQMRRRRGAVGEALALLSLRRQTGARISLNRSLTKGRPVWSQSQAARFKVKMK